MCAEMCGVVFFFFQAEDGIRDVAVTGVQTCALPISGIAVPFWNAVLDSENAIRPPPFHAPAVASATMSSDGAARRGMALLYKIKPGARTAPRADGSGEVAVTLPPQPGGKLAPRPPRRVGARRGPCQKTVRAPCQSSARGAFLG